MTFYNSAYNFNMNLFSGLNSFSPGFSSFQNPFMGMNSVFSSGFNFMPYSSPIINFSMPAFNFTMPAFTMPALDYSMPTFNFTMPSFDTFSFNSKKTTKVTNNDTKVSSDGLGVLRKAESYVGKVNSDAEGVRLFSPKGSPASRGWCCDFATYCASKALGSKYPKAMITGSPGGLMNSAKQYNCFSSGWSKPAKPGDLIITPGKGASGLHVAIVKSVDSDGKITAISGNSSNKVKISRYNSSSVKGVVHIDQLA